MIKVASQSKNKPADWQTPDLLMTVSLPTRYGAGLEVKLRPDSLDSAAFERVFVDESYRLDVDTPGFIIDAGAQVGLTSMYFALQYPDATVVAIEADNLAWRIARQNLASFRNVHLLRGALWPRKAHLGIGNRDASPWGFRLLEDLGGKFALDEDQGLSIPGFTIESVMDHFGYEFIDILRLDIEGSEVEVLPAVPMEKVAVLVCETHDRYIPGCTDALYAAARGWSEITRGETHILSGPKG